jgi:hypothetical protein
LGFHSLSSSSLRSHLNLAARRRARLRFLHDFTFIVGIGIRDRSDRRAVRHATLRDDIGPIILDKVALP